MSSFFGVLNEEGNNPHQKTIIFCRRKCYFVVLVDASSRWMRCEALCRICLTALCWSNAYFVWGQRCGYECARTVDYHRRICEKNYVNYLKNRYRLDYTDWMHWCMEFIYTLQMFLWKVISDNIYRVNNTYG